ncbi:hypothetical protein PVAP13_2NG041538 [Panicum virgatum]|uniref:Uncharacterized protein n=1 Tax=Panicum virgatum TaxID=38727 RepID=A0A8T0VFT9_PANVG|nr:hypothetical protein PVAP13_2NG041538 [Panicum virgatum]
MNATDFPELYAAAAGAMAMEMRLWNGGCTKGRTRTSSVKKRCTHSSNFQQVRAAENSRTRAYRQGQRHANRIISWAPSIFSCIIAVGSLDGNKRLRGSREPLLYLSLTALGRNTNLLRL